MEKKPLLEVGQILIDEEEFAKNQTWIEDLVGECPKCQELGLRNGDNYCSNCGVKVGWMTQIRECDCGAELTGNLFDTQCPDCKANDAAKKKADEIKRITDIAVATHNSMGLIERRIARLNVMKGR